MQIGDVQIYNIILISILSPSPSVEGRGEATSTPHNQ
jgi:hypothetical protein